ncbi:hypothetical protein D3C72_1983050 [compost metagenome]
MALELPHVVASGLARTETSPALFQVQQGRFDFDALAHPLDSHEQMLLVEAPMLPARPVETRQHAGHLREELLVDRHAETLTATFGIPLAEFLKALQLLRYQQSAP